MDDPVVDKIAQAELGQQPDTSRSTARILLQPKRTAAERSSGVKNRKVTYMGRMSSSGGQ